jgi:hypothetical protein
MIYISSSLVANGLLWLTSNFNFQQPIQYARTIMLYEPEFLNV